MYVSTLRWLAHARRGMRMAGNATRLGQIDERLRGDLKDWLEKIQNLRTEFVNAAGSKNKYDPSWFAGHLPTLNRLTEEMSRSFTNLTVINQDLVAAKSDAEYREVLVRAWPTNHFLDRMTYIGTAVLGAGGAAYLFVGLDLALFFWGVGVTLMGAGLAGLWEWERKKWDFYADQFSVDERYRPWKRRRGRAPSRPR